MTAKREKVQDTKKVIRTSVVTSLVPRLSRCSLRTRPVGSFMIINVDAYGGRVGSGCIVGEMKFTSIHVRCESCTQTTKGKGVV